MKKNSKNNKNLKIKVPFTFLWRKKKQPKKPRKWRNISLFCKTRTNKSTF